MGGGRDKSAQSSGPKPQTYVVEDLSGIDSELDQFNQSTIEINPNPAAMDSGINDDSTQPKNTTFTMPDSGVIEFSSKQPVPDPKQEALKAEELKKLESIIFTGKLSRDVDIAGTKFTLSTLANRENNQIVRKLMTIGDTADLLTIRVLTLAYTIRKINDVEFGDLVESDDGIESMDKRISIIDSMQTSVIEKLWEEYESLVEEHEKLIIGDNIKK